MALKLIKARKNETEVENDLRGLGHTSIFQDMTPEPILSIESEHQSLNEGMNEAARELGLAPHPLMTHGHHLHCTDDKLSHKEKAMNLFAFSLLHHLHTGAKATLWERNRLHRELHIGIRVGNGEETPLLQAPQISSALSLGLAVQLHLRQAGFHLEGKLVENELHLETQQVAGLLAQFAEVKAEKAAHKTLQLRVA